MKGIEKNLVLIVYSDETVPRDIKNYLGSSEFDYIEAKTISEALSKITFSAPKLILSELNLAKDTGLDLCRVIRSSLKTKLIPFIIISEKDNFDERIRAIQSGADAFITKPLNPEEIIAHIKAKISQFNEFYLLSITDELTRLYNRREFLKRFENEVGTNPETTISLSIIDLDFFKQVNDVYGHQIGDLVLMKLGDILNNSLSKSFFPTRFGGEEFVIMMAGLNAAEAKETIDRIREEFHSSPFTTSNNKTFHVSFSAGISEYPSFGRNLSVLLSRADQALYAAKKDGKNRTYVFDPIMARNDRFWEYLKKKTGFFLNKKGMDAATGLPFLPNVLETISNLNYEIESIGIIIYDISSIFDIRSHFGSVAFDMIIENLKIFIQKSCENHYATDTYFAVSDILNYNFIVMFPSIIDLSENIDKCTRLYNEITEDINSKISTLPYSLNFSSSVVILNKKEIKQILTDIQDIKDMGRPFDDRNEKTSRILNKIQTSLKNDKLIISEYFSKDYFYKITDQSKCYQYLSFNGNMNSFTSFQLLLETIIRSKKHLISFLEQAYLYTDPENLPVVFPWIRSINFTEYASLVSSIFSGKDLFLAINENYLYHNDGNLNLDKIGALPPNINLAISNCYISSELLNILSRYDFGMVCISEHLSMNMHFHKDRIKILNGFKYFVDQLGIITCVDNLTLEEELQLVKDLNLQYASGSAIRNFRVK